MKNKMGLIFGSFDGFHLGHQYFIEKAKDECDKLVLALARDEIIKKLKKREPRYSFAERMERIKSIFPDIEVKSGDEVLGEYTMIRNDEPDIIFIGHDQSILRDDIDNWLKVNGYNIAIRQLKGYNEKKFKSSIIYDRHKKI